MYKITKLNLKYLMYTKCEVENALTVRVLGAKH